MPDTIDQSLQRITGGAVLLLLGTGIGMLLGMVGRIMTARYFSESDYGIFSLGMIIISFVVMIATMGLQLSSARQIAFFRAKEDKGQVAGLVSSSLQLTFIFSIVCTVVLYFAADIVSLKVFKTPELSGYLKVLCVAIAFSAIIQVLAGIYRGFDKVWPRIYFQELLRNALFPVLLIAVFVFHTGLTGVVWAYVLSFILALTAFAFYGVFRQPLPVGRLQVMFNRSIALDLLLFSIPLAGLVMLNNIVIWSDTLMLGYFMEPADVGTYNAALPVAHILPTILAAIDFMYVPLMSQFYALGQKEEMKRIYAMLSKWVLAFTLPFFMIFMFFPGATLNIFFGPSYTAAAVVLQLLTIGFFLNPILGPSASSLIVFGENRFLMWSILITASANVVMNILLIPRLGITGAALATTLALIIRNALYSTKLYKDYRIHPFTRNYIKPALASVCIITVIYILVRNVISTIVLWHLPVFFIGFLGVYIISLLLTRSFDREDMMMLTTIEEKTGINLSLVKRLIRMFL